MAEYIFEINNAFYDDKTGQVAINPEYKGKLVRCKDCHHYNTKHSACLLNDSICKESDFCSYGCM